MPLEFVDLATAKDAQGIRLVVNSLVPSPWSEAAKGCLRIAGLPAMLVRRGMDQAEIDAWTGVDNVPVLIHEREPIRTHWAAIVTFVDRLARARGGAPILPDAVAARAHQMGLLHEIAGEEGVGWNARLAMIDAGLTGDGSRGFPAPIAKFLARRYGHPRRDAAWVHARVAEQLRLLADALESGGGRYFGGDSPSALDVYSATFLTPVVAPLDDASCPRLAPPFRDAFGAAHDAFVSLVPTALLEHRARMFAEHLAWPLAL